MAGNTYDWTLEASSSSNRVDRGGSYDTLYDGSSFPSAGRNSLYPYINYEAYGTRSALYITP